MTVSVVLPILELNEWHERLTDHAIHNLRGTAGADFELVIVETCGERLREFADVYVHRDERTNLSADMNAAANAATQQIIIHTANDIVLSHGWVESLIEPFRRFQDCGAATLKAQTHTRPKIYEIEEGFYGPVMAYDSRWRFDEANFPSIFGDTDMVMRIYREGLRMYRNWAGQIKHIGQGEQTYKETMSKEDRVRKFNEARQRFFDKHRDCGLMMFRALYEGWPI